ncbi:TraB/GumN family protein [Haloarchaeobius iranensis]|uniref:TraB family protein n=1 Tax=Haloarchaeobius iranensis TaxID=996166 RepID=A0A1H0AQR2_9EURY|nr:TraB/GumN family protein [Haloarchaeobius iranensis]SDN35817.1 TraB family protein [Haloarchaeobius iranensis]
MSDSAAPPAPEPPDPPGDGEGSVSVLGTAHVSERSVEEVRETIAEEQPDVVAVELDEDRYRQMRGETPDDIEPRDLLEGNTVFQFIAYWMLSYVQTRMGEQFDIEPGADMLAAVETAEEHGLGVSLVDRDIQVTIQRFWRRMTALEKVKMMSGLIFGVADALVVGVTAGLFVGLFLGPLAGFAVPALFGVGTTTVQSVAGGSLVGLLAGYLLWEGGMRTMREDQSIALGAIGGATVGAGVAASGLTAPYVATLLGGGLGVAFAAGLLGGILTGVGVGAALGLVLAVAGYDADEVEEYDEFDIDDLTDGDVVTAMMEEFRRFSPGGAQALIDERDAYIAHNLVALRNQGYSVVAVVGAGHREGIEGYLENPDTLPPMASLRGTEKQRRVSIMKVFVYLLTVGYIAFFFLLVMAGVNDLFLLKLFAAWFLYNGLFAFGFAKLAGARWTSAGVGGAIAWLTSLNPVLAPGWFAGYMELRKDPVNVGDIATLNQILGDEESPLADVVRRMFEVPLFKLIMVVAATNIGSVIASFSFPVVVLPWLAPDEIDTVNELMDVLLRGARNSAEIIVGLL